MFWFGVAACLLALSQFYKYLEDGDKKGGQDKKSLGDGSTEGTVIIRIHIHNGTTGTVNIGHGSKEESDQDQS